MGAIVRVWLGHLVSTLQTTSTTSALTFERGNSWSSLHSYLHVVGDKTPRWMLKGGLFNFLNIFSIGGGIVISVLLIVSWLGERWVLASLTVSRRFSRSSAQGLDIESPTTTMRSTLSSNQLQQLGKRASRTKPRSLGPTRSRSLMEIR